MTTAINGIDPQENEPGSLRLAYGYREPTGWKSTVNEQQIRTYSTALGEQYNVERSEAEILLRRLSQHPHSFEIIGYAVSLLGQGVAVQTLIDAAANLGAVSEQLVSLDEDESPSPFSSERKGAL
jgi:hypothetical protein